MKNIKLKKIVIVGLGLMGGSLAAACRKQFPRARIVGVTRNRKALKLALKKKWIHEGTDKISKGACCADLVVLCTPVDTYVPLLKQIDKVVKAQAMVMDVGSVKGAVHQAVDREKWRRLCFVGTHPMVGSHKRGIEATCPRLYENSLVILTRTKKTCPDCYALAVKFWKRIAKKIVHLKPELHDKLIGEISHLPHALAVCLVQAVSDQALPFAAKGFRDTTRISASAPSIWLPIFKANKKQVLAELGCFEREMKRFKKSLCSPNAVVLKRYLDQAQKKRQAL